MEKRKDLFAMMLWPQHPFIRSPLSPTLSPHQKFSTKAITRGKRIPSSASNRVLRVVVSATDHNFTTRSYLEKRTISIMFISTAANLLRASRQRVVAPTTALSRSTLSALYKNNNNNTIRSIVTTSFRLPDPANDPHAVELTKIVATIGPTSERAEPLQKVTAAGMKIMRLNFSHATTEEVELRCTNLASAEVSDRVIHIYLYA